MKFENGSEVLRFDCHLHTVKDKEFKYSGMENEFVSDYVGKLEQEKISVTLNTYTHMGLMMPVKRCLRLIKPVPQSGQFHKFAPFLHLLPIKIRQKTSNYIKIKNQEIQ